MMSSITQIVEKAREVIEKEELEERRKTLIYIAKEVWKLLKLLIEEEGLITETGGRYPISWLIEDMILWIMSDEKRLQQFLDDTYEVIE